MNVPQTKIKLFSESENIESKTFPTYSEFSADTRGISGARTQGACQAVRCFTKAPRPLPCGRKVFSGRPTNCILVKALISNPTDSTPPIASQRFLSFLYTYQIQRYFLDLGNTVNEGFLNKIGAVDHCCCFCDGLYNWHSIYGTYAVLIFCCDAYFSACVIW